MDGDGALKVTVGDQTEVLKAGGYAYAPPQESLSFVNDTAAAGAHPALQAAFRAARRQEAVARHR